MSPASYRTAPPRGAKPTLPTRPPAGQIAAAPVGDPAHAGVSPAGAAAGSGLSVAGVAGHLLVLGHRLVELLERLAVLGEVAGGLRTLELADGPVDVLHRGLLVAGRGGREGGGAVGGVVVLRVVVAGDRVVGQFRGAVGLRRVLPVGLQRCPAGG